MVMFFNAMKLRFYRILQKIFLPSVLEACGDYFPLPPLPYVIITPAHKKHPPAYDSCQIET